MKFEDLLKNVEKPKISFSMKDKIKSRILTSLKSDEFKLSDLVMSENKKFVLKERILERIAFLPQRRFLLQRLFLFQKKFISFAMIFVMCFGLFSFVNVDTSVVRASSLTTVENVLGHVYVERNDEMIEAYDGMKLYADDFIRTGREASCEIHYFDDSVSRLRNNTELRINELKNFYGLNSQTYVEVEILDGVVWSKVLNLVDSSSFVVESGEVFTKAKKAAFNVEYRFDDLEIEVFNNIVEIHRPDQVDQAQKVVTGHRVKVDTKRDLVVEKIDKEEKNDEWIATNLEEDKEYVLELENKKIDEKKSLIAYEEDNLRTDTMLMLTFDDVKKKKKEMDLVEQKFMSSELKLREADFSELEKEELEAQIYEFKEYVEEYYVFIDEVEEKDPKYAADLKAEMNDKLLLYKKDLVVLLPDSSAYIAKDVVESLVLDLDILPENIVASNNVDEAQEKLSEMEDLIDAGKVEYVDDLAEEYKEEVVQAIDSLKEEEVLLDFKEDDADIVENSEEGENEISEDVKNEEILADIVDLEVQRLSIESQLKEEGVIVENIIEEDLLADFDVDVEIDEKVMNEDDVLLENEYEEGSFGVQIHDGKPVSPILSF